MTPYLSIVMGVGGVMSADLLGRLSVSTHNTISLAAQHKLKMELIIVEWRTPASEGAPSLLEAIDWPSAHIPIRIIHVPPEVHQSLPNPYGFRYFEWYPKNLGIRASRGRFVLSTNPDDLFPSELIQFFAQEQLEEGKFYRANRHDMRDGKVYLICRAHGAFPADMAEEQTRRIVGWTRNTADWQPNQLHFCASGDFTLMSRADWFRLRGNPEQPYNNSVDGQTLWLAHTLGMEQVILPYPIFHPDHVRTLNREFCPDWDDKRPHTKQNGENWGLRGMSFAETAIVRGSRYTSESTALTDAPCFFPVST